MGAVQGLYVEIDFKFKNETFMKGIKQVKEILKSMNVDLSNISKTAQGTMKNTGQAIKKGIETNLKHAKKSVDEVRSSMEKISKIKIDKPFDEFSKKAKKSSEIMNKFQKGANNIARGAMYKVGSMAVQGFQEGFKGVADIDFNIRGAVAKTGTMEKGYKDMMDLANEIGGKTKFNNLDAALAINSAATLGLLDKEIKTLMPSTANLAQAFSSDLNKTLESTIAYINTYNLKVSEATKVNDMVAVTAKKSAADLERLQGGFQYVGSTAKSMNIPLESVFAVLGKLNDSGIYGSSAGTALNNFLVQVSKNAPKIEKMIGEKLTDKDGKLKALPDIFEKVADKVKNLDDTTRNAILFDLFGIRGGKNIMTFLNQGVDGLRKLEEEIKNSNGTVNMMSEFMMKGIGGAIEEFLSTMETAFQSVFQALEPLLMPIFISLTLIGDTIININKHFPFLAQTIATIAGLVVGKAVFLLLAKQIDAVKKALLGIGKKSMLSMIGWAAVIMIVYYAFKKFKQALEKDKKAQKQWQKILEGSKKALKTLVKVVMEFLSALLGLNKQEKLVGDGPLNKKTSDLASNLSFVKDMIEKLTKKLEDFSKWIKDHKKDIEDFGKLIKDWGPIMAAVATSAWLLANPLMLITIGVAMIPLAEEALKKEMERSKKSAEQMEKEIKNGKNRREASSDYMKREQEANYNWPLIGQIVKWKDKILNPIIEPIAAPISKSLASFIAGGHDDNGKPKEISFDAWKKSSGDHLKYIKESNMKTFDTMKKPVGDYLKYLFESNMKTLESIKNGFKALGESIIGVFSSICESVKNWFIDVFNQIVEYIKGKFEEVKSVGGALAGSLQPFINKLLDALGILDKIKGFSGTVIEIGTKVIIDSSGVNGVKQLMGDNGPGSPNKPKAKQTWTGTENFSGGYTTINEKGDELILGPTGMVVANNPSTMNIMTDLNNIKRNLSQLRFGNSENAKAATNNIVINIGNISSKSEVDYLISQLDTLDLS